MKALLVLISLVFASNFVFAQSTNECQDMVKLRDRSGSLDLALSRLDAGVDLALVQNADFTSQLMTILLFETYMCRLNQVITARGQSPIPPDVLDAWVDELSSVYSTVEEAIDGKLPGTIKASFNKASTDLTNAWKPAGVKPPKYQYKVPVDVSKDFLAAVPAVDLTRNIKLGGSLYLKTVITKGFTGEYESAVSKGEAMVGNQMYAMESMRKSVGLFAKGSLPAASMLREIVKGSTSALSQITTKHSDALTREQMRLDAEAKARELTASTASLKIAELEARLAAIEKNITKN